MCEIKILWPLQEHPCYQICIHANFQGDAPFHSNQFPTISSDQRLKLVATRKEDSSAKATIVIAGWSPLMSLIQIIGWAIEHRHVPLACTIDISWISCSGQGTIIVLQRWQTLQRSHTGSSKTWLGLLLGQSLSSATSKWRVPQGSATKKKD